MVFVSRFASFPQTGHLQFTHSSIPASGAQKISLLATDRELYKRLSANARETYESKFTLEKMCDAYKKLYYEIL